MYTRLEDQRIINVEMEGNIEATIQPHYLTYQKTNDAKWLRELPIVNTFEIILSNIPDSTSGETQTQTY